MEKNGAFIIKNYTVICSDLRGYGDSDKPKSDDKHYTYSKKSMAYDQNALMKKLGFDNYYLVGHDRVEWPIEWL